MADEQHYLDEVARRLPFTDDIKADVIAEIRAHLEDTQVELTEQGRGQSEASAGAMARLGPPDRLAQEIARAHQTRRRLLSAVGWGALEAAGMGLLGFTVAALGAAIVGTMLFIAGLAATLNGRDAATTSVIAAVALFFIGRAVPGMVALRARRALAWARRATLFVGIAVLVPVAFLALPADHTPTSIVVTLGSPFALALGVQRSGGARRRSAGRDLWLAPAIGALAIGITMLAGSAPSVPDERIFIIRIPDLPGLDAVGPVDRSLSEIGDHGGSCCPISLHADYSDATGLARYADLRFELWPATDGLPGLDPAFGPLLTVPARRVGPADPGNALAVRFEADVRWTLTREQTNTWALLTGRGPDGRRYVLSDARFQAVRFEGTAVEWLLAARSRSTLPTETTAPSMAP